MALMETIRSPDAIIVRQQMVAKEPIVPAVRNLDLEHILAFVSGVYCWQLKRLVPRNAEVAFIEPNARYIANIAKVDSTR